MIYSESDITVGDLQYLRSKSIEFCYCKYCKTYFNAKFSANAIIETQSGKVYNMFVMGLILVSGCACGENGINFYKASDFNDSDELSNIPANGVRFDLEFD